ncbi:MAG TPA: hypothetical protein VFK38_00490 [Candidatus Limnocylindrales bacterium]|nr:hypothetical protein [Candidatus Limnocylindrales bacterium]
MRRITSALLISALLVGTLAAPAAAGQTTYNSNGSAVIAQGSWDAYDESTGTFSYGGATAWQEQGKPAFIEVFTSSAIEVICDNGTPGDPADDYPGAQGSGVYGYGSASLSVGRSYGSALASAVIDVDSFTFDDCTWSWTSDLLEDVPVSLSLTGDGDLIMERSSGSFKIPSQINAHGSFRATYRSASGSATIDGTSYGIDYGAIGKVAWSEHFNEN